MMTSEVTPETSQKRIPKMKLSMCSPHLSGIERCDKMDRLKKIQWVGKSLGIDPREEFLLKFCGVPPVALDRHCYLAFESSLSIGIDLIQEELLNDIKLGAMYLRREQKKKINLCTEYDRFLGQQLEGLPESLPVQQPVKTQDEAFTVNRKQDGTIVVGLKYQTIVFPPPLIPLVRLTPEEIDRFKEPAKRPNYADPFYSNISALCKKELDLVAKKEEIRRCAVPVPKKLTTPPISIKPPLKVLETSEVKITAPSPENGKIKQPSGKTGINGKKGKVKQTSSHKTPIFSVKPASQHKVESLPKKKFNGSDSYELDSRKSKLKQGFKAKSECKKPEGKPTLQFKGSLNLNGIHVKKNVKSAVTSTSTTSTSLFNEKKEKSGESHHAQKRKQIQTERPEVEVKISKTETIRNTGFKIPKAKPVTEIIRTSPIRSLAALTEITCERKQINGTRIENIHVQETVRMKYTEDLSTFVKSVPDQFIQPNRSKQIECTTTNGTVDAEAEDQFSVDAEQEDTNAELERNNEVATNAEATSTQSKGPSNFDDDDQDVLELCVSDYEEFL